MKGIHSSAKIITATDLSCQTTFPPPCFTLLYIGISKYHEGSSGKSMIGFASCWH
jgi:hypothetical protein